jgi:hypothetical protein
MGIAPELVPYVFDRFRQRQHQHTALRRLGLGLSIVGTSSSCTAVGVGRERGRGRRALGSHCPSEADANSNGAPRATLAVPSLIGTRVLVAEDKPDARTQLQTSLERYGATVVGVATIAERWT